MAELGLDHVHRHALTGQLGRVGVTQPMRVHTLLDASPCCEALDSVPDVGGIDGSAVQGAEQRCAALDPEGFSLFEPTFDESEGTSVEAYGSGAVALARSEKKRRDPFSATS